MAGAGRPISCRRFEALAFKTNVLHVADRPSQIDKNRSQNKSKFTSNNIKKTISCGNLFKVKKLKAASFATNPVSD